MTRVHLPVLGRSAPPTLLPETGAVAPEALVDPFARRVRYLRVSVTDRCNFRCSYCMPEALGETVQFQRRSELLTFEEIVRIVRVFAGLGVRKLRLTGGEPTVRSHIVDLVAQVAAVPGIDEVAMTTNGVLLGELAAPLRAAGLHSVNISIDTLDPARFRAVTGRGDVAQVIAGIDAAVAAGLRVKLNAVALRGVNDDELLALCELAWSRGAVPRFIEHMPMSDGALFHPADELTAAQIRAELARALGPLTPASAARDAGPARYWRVGGDPAREVGIISAMTEHFCDDCNRLRITALGDLHACLGHDDATSLRDVLRAGGSDRDLTLAIARSVDGKRAGHEFERTGEGGPRKHMIAMGG